MDISTLYLFLSKDETNVENDVKLLVKKNILSLDEINKDDTLLVCISRDYFDKPYNGPALMIRDQLSNVFCPEWRLNSIRYEPFRNFSKKSLSRPFLKVIVKDEDVYENLDYYMHLKSFDRVEKMNINDKTLEFVPVESKIEDYVELGELTVAILEEAGYDKDQNGPVPGWVFQCANPWLGRLMDLRGISPIYRKEFPPYVYTTKDDLIRELKNPTVLEGPYVGEDARSIFMLSYIDRKLVYEESKFMLENL